MNIALRIILGLAVGGGAGYGLSRLLCLGGGCPITSNRPLMVLLGALVGVTAVLSGCTKAGRSTQAAASVDFGTALTTVEEFDAKVVGSGKPALVDFYADWCGPCRMLKPVLAKLEAEYAGRIDFYRVDIDLAKGLAKAHNVSGVPTLLLYSAGRQHGCVAGFRPEEAMRKHLDALVAGD